MELHLKITGVCLIALGLVHAVFPKQFSWKQELAPLGIFNRQVMYVHTFFIALTVFLMGLLCLTSPAELIHTALGKRISLGLGIFWAIRLFVQFFVYSPKTWRGKRFETVIHILFSVFWIYVTAVFILVYVS